MTYHVTNCKMNAPISIPTVMALKTLPAADDVPLLLPLTSISWVGPNQVCVVTQEI